MTAVLDYIEPAIRDLAVPLDTVKLDDKNARLHSKRNLDSIAKSLGGFKQQKPIVVTADGRCIAGNGTLEAAKALGWSHIAVAQTTLKGDHAKAYAIADNRTAELAEWEDKILAEALVAIQDSDEIDADATGFTSREIDGLVSSTSGEIEEDEVPGPPKKAITQRGDLWQLGEHRVLCGDATSREDVGRVMGGEKADAVLTDPPYGIGQSGVPHDSPAEHASLIWGAVRLLPVTDAVVIAFQSTRTFPEWLSAIRASGFAFERMLSLYKEAQCTYPWRGWILITESILVATVGEPKWNDVKPYVHDAYRVAEVSGELSEGAEWHGSVKPVAVVRDILSRICRPGDSAFDPFLGSGTTLIAAEQLNRRCYGLEIEPKYCDVIVQRWENLTGRKAERIKAG